MCPHAVCGNAAGAYTYHYAYYYICVLILLYMRATHIGDRRRNGTFFHIGVCGHIYSGTCSSIVRAQHQLTELRQVGLCLCLRRQRSGTGEEVLRVVVVECYLVAVSGEGEEETLQL